MKYLTLFNNNSEFESAQLETPNVSYVKESGDLIYKPSPKQEQIFLNYHFDIPHEGR